MSFETFEHLERGGFEELTAFADPRSGARAVLAVHSTRLGPAFGGIRRWKYLDETGAARDALRLARAMTHKCALAGVPAGGAKLVILDRPGADLQAVYRFVGELVERRGGRFFTGPDVGTGPRELAAVRSRTRFVTDPGPKGPGELGASTAAGVVSGIEAALRHLDGAADWERRTVVVQGLGEVGARVARELRRRGARVLAADVDAERAAEAARDDDLELIDAAAQLDVPCDVFAPCALGGIVHDLTLLRARCRVLAGAANNVLVAPEHGDRLHERGVLYVPDVAINSGALIRGATFQLTGERLAVEQIAARVGEVVASVLRQAAAEKLPPARVAEREAELRVELAAPKR
jgi:glutamate dehydrogenase/leucine dehydrogenase